MKKNATKSALLMSVVSLMLCFTMLLGTTFAWFTDNAASTNNVIKAGNLDVVLEYKTLNDTDWKPVEETTKLFKEGALYEPGYTEVVFLRISNAGNLALKYSLSVIVNDEITSTNVNNGAFSLTDHLEIGYYTMDESMGQYLLGAMFGTRSAAIDSVNSVNGTGFKKLSAAGMGAVRTDAPVLPGTDTAQLVAIVLTMPETVGNEANRKADAAVPMVDLGVYLQATQLPSESDSFGHDYDANAQYPKIPEIIEVTGNTPAALTEAIANAQNGDTVKLTENVAVTNLTVEKAVTIDLNGHTIQTEAWGGVLLKNGASLKNGTVEHISAVAAIKAWDAESIENVTISVTTATANNHITGIAVQSGSHVGSIKNVTVTGASQGIEIAYGASVDRIENANVTARTINANLGTALQINGGYVGKVVNSTFNGEVYGAHILLKGTVAVGASFENCKLIGGTAALHAWDEVGIANNVAGSTLTINYDDATVSNSGNITWSFENECLPVVKINNATPTVTP